MIFFFVLTLQATAAVRCEKMADRLCDFFRKNIAQQFISGPDDTFVVNPQFVTPSLTQRPKDFAHLFTVARLLETIDKPGLSAYAKVELAGRAPDIFTKDEVDMHWPLDKADASVQTVKTADVLASLAKVAGGPARDAYVKVAREKRDEIEAYNAELQAMNPNVAFAEKVKAMPAEWKKKRVARLEELIKFARDSNVDVVTRGNPDPATWTDEQKNLVARLGVRVTLLSEDEAAREPRCWESPANASLLVAQDRVVICPAAIALPDAQLVATLAHELAHAIGPCATQGAFGRLDAAKVSAFLKAGGLNQVNKTRLEDLMKKGTVNLDAELASLISDPRFTSKLVAAGAVDVKAPALKAMPSVYRDVYTCLARQYGFRVPTEADRQARVRDVYDAQFNYREGAHADKAQILEYYRYLSTTFSECPFLSGPKTQMDEVIADAFGTVAKDKHARLFPPKSETEKMLAMGAAQVCEYKEQLPGQLKDMNAQGITAMMDDAPESANFRRLLKNEHPSDVTRAALEVDLPGLAKIYDCERPPSMCLDDMAGSATPKKRAVEAGTTR